MRETDPGLRREADGLGLVEVVVDRHRHADLVAHQHALVDHAAEVLGALVIDHVAVHVHVLGQIDLGPHDVQEADGVALGQLAGALGVDDVVGVELLDEVERALHVIHRLPGRTEDERVAVLEAELLVQFPRPADLLGPIRQRQMRSIGDGSVLDKRRVLLRSLSPLASDVDPH